MKWLWLGLLGLAAAGGYLAWNWPGISDPVVEVAWGERPPPVIGENVPLEGTFPPITESDVGRPPTPQPADVVRIDDRTVRVANRFELTGNGTERDPYRISWEYLQSAQDGWKPKDGKESLARHILLLDGAWISIDGYWAPGIVVDETQEVIVLLNRWDGCCLGIPPTPYDCIEAKLTEPVRIDKQHSFRYGTVTGRLEVSPFSFGDVVLGLYRFHDARISSQ